MLSRNINIILGALLAVALTTAFVLALTVFGELKKQRVQTASLLAAVNQRVGVASDFAADFLKTTSKDMLFLQSLLSEEESGATWSEAGLQKFMNRNAAYEELYLFDSAGECLFRAVRRASISKQPCGTVADVITSAREAARQLSEGELFLSPLLQYQGMRSLVYAMSLKDARAVAAIVSAESFLEEVRRLAREDEAVFLTDGEGGYLAHPNRLKEKLLGAPDNFYTDFPEAPRGVLEDKEIARLDIERAVFSFWRIRPSESDFALYQGTQSAEAKRANGEQWVLVAVSKKAK